MALYQHRNSEGFSYHYIIGLYFCSATFPVQYCLKGPFSSPFLSPWKHTFVLPLHILVSMYFLVCFIYYGVNFFFSSLSRVSLLATSAAPCTSHIRMLYCVKGRVCIQYTALLLYKCFGWFLLTFHRMLCLVHKKLINLIKLCVNRPNE